MHCNTDSGASLSWLLTLPLLWLYLPRMNNILVDLSIRELKRAITIREKLDAMQTELHSILGSSADLGGASMQRTRKRRMSAAGRAAISAAATARWAKLKRGAVGKAGRKPKRRMSVAARAKMAAAAKKRWARAKAAGRNSL
jgi:hypothetical protein